MRTFLIALIAAFTLSLALLASAVVRSNGRGYPGPYLDCSGFSGMEAAYVEIHSSLMQVCSKLPPNEKINEVLAGNAPEYVVADAVASGKFVPSDKILAVVDSFEKFSAQRVAAQRADRCKELQAAGKKGPRAQKCDPIPVQ